MLLGNSPPVPKPFKKRPPCSRRPPPARCPHFPRAAEEALTLNISRFAALSLSSMRELDRGLDASLSERTIISGEGVNRPLSWSLWDKREKKD